MYLDHIERVMADYLSMCSELISCDDATLAIVSERWPGPEGEPARRILRSRRGMKDGNPYHGKPEGERIGR